MAVQPYRETVKSWETWGVAMTKPAKPRNAFDLPGTSEVVKAIKPRQRAYKAGPGISVVGSAQGRRDAEMRRAMRMTRI